MRREHKVVDEPSYNSVCFHAQQCAEKMLKAFHHTNDIYFPKTHDIGELLMRTLPVRPEWVVLIERYKFLNDYSVDARYPGDFIYKEDANEAVEACEELRKIILHEFRDFDQLRLG